MPSVFAFGYAGTGPSSPSATPGQVRLRCLSCAGLGHNVFTQDAIVLIVRSSDGILRRARNITIGSLIEAVRDQTRSVDIKQAWPPKPWRRRVNRVLGQPHWRRDYDVPTT